MKLSNTVFAITILTTLGARFPAGAGRRYFLVTASRPTQGPTQPLMRRIAVAVTPQIRRSHSALSLSAKVKHTWSYTSTQKLHIHGVVLSYAQRQLLRFYLYNIAFYSLTPWRRVLRKLTVTQLVKNFSGFYGTRSFITVFMRAHHQAFYSHRIL
jgi:hypothetical protein